MRRIVAFDRVSADGYFTDEDGKLDWTVPDPEIDKGAAARTSGQGTILFGRKTYDMFESFWPRALEDPNGPSDPHSGRRTPEMKAMAEYINDAVKIVWSRSRKELAWKNSRVLAEFDPRQVEALKKEPGGDMMIFGSGTIVSKLAEHGLVDEYQFIVGPVLLGGGRPLVSGLPRPQKLKLLEARPYPSGNVMLRFQTP